MFQTSSVSFHVWTIRRVSDTPETMGRTFWCRGRHTQSPTNCLPGCGHDPRVLKLGESLRIIEDANIRLVRNATFLNRRPSAFSSEIHGVVFLYITYQSNARYAYCVLSSRSSPVLHRAPPSHIPGCCGKCLFLRFRQLPHVRRFRAPAIHHPHPGVLCDKASRPRRYSYHSQSPLRPGSSRPSISVGRPTVHPWIIAFRCLMVHIVTDHHIAEFSMLGRIVRKLS